MITLQERTIVSQINIETFFKGFSEKFEQYITLFRITSNFDFEIDLKKEFQKDKKLKTEITQFFKKIDADFEVLFINNQLPF